MRRQEGKRDEAGFTIQEILVVLLVGSLLVNFSISTFLFLSRLFATWQRTVELHRVVTDAAHAISYDIQHSGAAYLLPDSSFLIEREAGRTILYRFGSGTLLRDGWPMSVENGPRLSGIITSGGTGDRDPALYRVEVTGMWKDRKFVARCDATPPHSSFASFGTTVRQSEGN